MNSQLLTKRPSTRRIISFFALGFILFFPIYSLKAQLWLSTPIIASIRNPSSKVERALDLMKSRRFELAVQTLRDAVDNDRDPDAQYLLGWCFANGKGVTRSLLQAEQSFFGAAQRKQMAALYSLGRLRIDTAQPGSTKRVESGIESLKSAAEQGMGSAMRVLGLLHKDGIPGALPPDAAEALRWFEKAGKAGDAEALYYQALLIESGDVGKADISRAVTLYNQAAANGSALAMLDLGEKAMQKKPSPDRKTAISWYQKAAALESAEARHRLGRLLSESDPDKAFDFFRIAADQGYAPAQADLGVAFEEGRGTSKDMSRAVKAYQKSAANGDPMGLYRLAICYEQGLGVSRNQDKATEGFQLSGQSGFAEAQHRMGVRYVSGEGAVKDIIAAAAWFQLGAAQGHAPCQRDLGEIFETSSGELRNPEKALELYRKAAEQGDAQAWFLLGRMVEQGNGTHVNLEVAYFLYHGSFVKGNANARSPAESVARRLTPAVVKRVEARYRSAPDEVPALE